MILSATDAAEIQKTSFRGVMDKQQIFKAEQARQNFKNKGLSYSDVKASDFFRLVSFVCEELENFNKLLDENPNLYGIRTMIISQRLKDNKPCFIPNENGTLKYAHIKVSSHYFEGREGITFWENEQIGFCSWASTTNEIPFINAFNRWVDTMEVRNADKT